MNLKDQQQLSSDLKVIAAEIDIDLIGVAGLEEKEFSLWGNDGKRIEGFHKKISINQ